MPAVTVWVRLPFRIVTGDARDCGAVTVLLVLDRFKRDGKVEGGLAGLAARTGKHCATATHKAITVATKRILE